MSWMKRRGQPSPNPTNPGVPMYNPNQHSNTQQPYQQWPQQPTQQYNNDWYSQSKGPSKTPPTSQFPSPNTNYWQQPSYNQPQQNFNPTIGHQNVSNLPQQVNQYQQFNNQFPTNQQPNYYQNTNNYPQDNFTQPQSYAQTQQSQNFYQQQPANVNQSQQIQHANHGIANQITTQPTEADPWNWGWDDTSNANSQPVQNEVINQNNITDSFANEESWNWSVEESSSSQSLSQRTESEPIITSKVEEKLLASQNTQQNAMQVGLEQLGTEITNNIVENAEVNNSDFYQNQPQNTDTLEDLPSLPNLRRIKNENLTPQWSIESQVSQDSSEDVLLTSESDNRSNILSQSSTTSHSPTRQHDPSNEFVPPTQMSYRYDSEINQLNQQGIISNSEHSQPSQEEVVNAEYYQENISNQPQTVDNMDKAMEKLSLNTQFENEEIVSPEGNNAEINEPVKNPTPPMGLAKKSTPPLIQPPPMMQQTASGSSNSPDLNKNPFKKKSGLSHKAINKTISTKEPLVVTPVSQNTDVPDPIFIQQNAPSAFTQIRPSSTENIPPRLENTENNLGVNLETVPDNSERPDMENIAKFAPPVDSVQTTIRKTINVQQQWAENCEIAPINDRNQYLETGQLSDADIPPYNQPGSEYQMENAQSTSGGDTNDSLPPPGLCRLVLGQMEQPETSQTNDNTLDAPPPGLSRKVIGSTAPKIKQTKAMSISGKFQIQAGVFQPPNYQTNEEPPAGLHRMVPGESSSPESSTYMFQTDASVFQPVNYDDGDNYVSESELNQMGVNIVSQRSATIGADTPPVTNQQTISNTGYSSSSSVDPPTSIPSREGAVGIDNEQQDKVNLGSSNQTEESNPASLPSDNNRREDIDGAIEETITAPAVRDQTVGQNTTDDLNTTSSNQNEKHRSRNYTTDSEHEQPKERHNRSSSPTNKYEKDRRYYDDRRDRQRYRDSPERYRGDKKYEKRRPKDRRYEDDTDYYSDKERSDRRHRDDREEYDKRYNSLRRSKDKDRRPERSDRREYDKDDRRNDYYYNSRYEDDYYNRSRPSSRTDSMHDSYRERNRHAERDLDRSTRTRSDRDRPRDPRRSRDPYNPTNYYQGYNYDPFHPYYQQYQYYEHLRRTNPQAYAEMYRKYYQNQGGIGPHAAGYSTEDRASVHSGRSSANEELNKDRYTRQSYYSQQSLPHYYREIPNASSTAYTVDDSRLLDHTDSSLNLEDTNATAQRLTPAKFSTAHVKASIASGNLIHILPHYPVDGQPATLEIISLQSVLYEDEDLKDLAEFPGPLIKGTTHKKTIIDYCENKIKRANGNNMHDVESYILMWELLILLLRQNGMVVGTDIAELLMKNRTFESSRRQSVSSTSSIQQLDIGHEQSEHTTNRASPAMHYKEDYITDKFREYLLYGSGKEALEWAMKHGLWGHALFLASKLDKRTYANVMMRFANGLTMNDPLQTLYQLLSGRQPAAVTCVADEKWGDWRPHLAMILSNTSQRPDLDRKAITTLGDTLQQRGNLYAAHFCYLMAQVEFGKYGSQNAKLVLLSSSHNKNFNAFATNEAIFMTEIYEYACSLSDPTFNIQEFQSYKYLMATRMVDHGLLEKGLLYLERVAVNIKNDPSRAQPSLVSRVCELADRLKYCDPVQDDGDLDNNRTEQPWLSELKAVLNDYNMGLITHQSTTNLTSLEPDQQQVNQYDQQYTEQWQQHQQLQSQQQVEYYQQQAQIPNQNQEQQPWQPQQPEQQQQQSVDYNNQQQTLNYQEGDIQQPSYDATNYQEQYWNQQNQTQQPTQPMWEESVDSSQQLQQSEESNQQNDYWNSAAAQSEQPKEQTNKTKSDEPRPQISMPNQTKSKNYFDSEENDALPKGNTVSKPKPVAPVPSKPASTGWFGGIWSKLALRPKNQMKLPDDKNPTIVWDSEKKRWVNLEEDNGDTTTEIKPPPKKSEMFPNKTVAPPSLTQTHQNNMNATPNVPNMPGQTFNDNNLNNQGITDNNTNNETDKKPPSGPNIFKLQRGRNLKKAYVDVFNPGGTKPAATANSLPAPDTFGNSLSATGGSQMNFFVPPPVANTNAPTDFLTPQVATKEENQTPLSRWSSASSLSREVQYYMQQRPKLAKAGGAPTMYNPNQFSNVGQTGNYPMN